MFETLEQRRMFAVTAAVVGTTLNVWGDGGDNRISVVVSGSDLVAKRYTGGSYVEFFRVRDSAVASINLFGYAGNDTLEVSDKVRDSVSLHGGSGRDRLKGGGGWSFLYGHGAWPTDPSGQHNPATDDAAADTLVSGCGRTEQWGQGGNDAHYTDRPGSNPESDEDRMYGGDGNDTFHLQGGSYAAWAYGGNGNDTFSPAEPPVQQPAFLEGGAGADILDYADWDIPIYAAVNGYGWSGPLNDAYDARFQLARPDVEIVRGTNKGDQFHGGDAANTFYGRGGNDTMYGNGGNDQLFGDGGNDVIFAGEGHDLARGGSGNDWLFGDGGNDALYGDAGNDTLYSGAGSDLLVGGSGSDWLYANDFATDDLLFGDNADGSGASGSTDHAVADRLGTFLRIYRDDVIGVESVTWTGL